MKLTDQLLLLHIFLCIPYLTLVGLQNYLSRAQRWIFYYLVSNHSDFPSIQSLQFGPSRLLLAIYQQTSLSISHLSLCPVMFMLDSPNTPSTHRKTATPSLILYHLPGIPFHLLCLARFCWCFKTLLKYDIFLRTSQVKQIYLTIQHRLHSFGAKLHTLMGQRTIF